MGLAFRGPQGMSAIREDQKSRCTARQLRSLPPYYRQKHVPDHPFIMGPSFPSSSVPTDGGRCASSTKLAAAHSHMQGHDPMLSLQGQKDTSPAHRAAIRSRYKCQGTPHPYHQDPFWSSYQTGMDNHPRQETSPWPNTQHRQHATCTSYPKAASSCSSPPLHPSPYWGHERSASTQLQGAFNLWHIPGAALVLSALTSAVILSCPPAFAEAIEAETVAAPMSSRPLTPGNEDAIPFTVNTQVLVSVDVKAGADLVDLGPSPTLFLTARPANYKVPFASKQITLSASTLSFPMDILLGSSEDLLVAPAQYQQLAELLDRQDILVSARLDRDGDPRTRDAEDLVGRGVAQWVPAEGGIQGPRTKAQVVLEGRGLFGKLVTSRQR